MVAQFCEKCQKVGHVCNKEKNAIVKKWQQKIVPNVNKEGTNTEAKAKEA